MPPLVLAVVTATENARMLEKWSGFFFNKAFSSSVQRTQFSGQNYVWSECKLFPKPVSVSLPRDFVDFCWKLCDYKAPKYKSPCLLVWLTDTLCSLEVSPALPSQEGSPQRLSPLGRHENTDSKNRGILLSFQLFSSSVCSFIGLRRHSQIKHALLSRNYLHPAEKYFGWFLSILAGRLHSVVTKSAQG